MTDAKPAKHGTGHFIWERVTSIFLLVLLPWFIVSIAASVHGDYESTLAWAKNPINAIGLWVFLVVSLIHARLGMQVVIEDYISHEGPRRFWLAVNSLVALAAGIAGSYFIYRIGS